MNTALNENKTELGVLVLAVAVEMLAHADGLLNKHVQVFGDVGRQTVRLQDTQDLLAGDRAHLRHTHGVTKMHADLGRHKTLLRELANLVHDFTRLNLQPCRRIPLVWQRRL